MSSIVEADQRQLPEPVARRGITESQWRTMCNSLFPGANPQSIVMVWDYCRARKLDPLKKPCHIVPMRVKDARTGQWVYRDVVMPGIYEYRTTATRTGLYLGHSKPEYGFEEESFGVQAPAWCEMTMYRWSKEAAMRIEFPVRVYFREACGTKRDKDGGGDRASDRWAKAPIQMLTKCTEAAGLREAFPDEFGGTATMEEMESRHVEHDVTKVTAVAKIVAGEEAHLVDDERVTDAAVGLAEMLKDGDDEGVRHLFGTLTSEAQTAVWTLLDSKQRSAIKKINDTPPAEDVPE